MNKQQPTSLPLTDANPQEQPLTYEEQFALNRARWNEQTAKRFNVPLWVLRDPGPRVDVEDDDILD